MRRVIRQTKRGPQTFRRRASFRGTPESKSVDSLKKRADLFGVNMRLSASGIVGSLDVVIAAVIHTDNRHEYQEEMIRNYLSSARARFLKEKGKKRQDGPSDIKIDQQEALSQCVVPGCSLYGTAETRYMCSSCYNQQKSQAAGDELQPARFKNSPPRHKKSNNDFESLRTENKVALSSKRGEGGGSRSAKSSTVSLLAAGNGVKPPPHKAKLHLSTI